MWNINGKKYDLTEFADFHPGGKDIILMAKNLEDITPLFETYHAFSDKEYIYNKLSQYEIVTEELTQHTKLYDFTEYNKVTNTIKKETILKNRNHIKINNFWIIKNILLFAFYVYTFYIAFFDNIDILYKYIASFVSGCLWICIGFNVMHDASHFGLFKNYSSNMLLSYLWNTWALWNEKIWFYHHVYSHHSFTGEEKQDSDLIHFRPFIRKFSNDKSIHTFFGKIQDKIVSFITIIFPGMFFGQSLSYIIASYRNKLWRVQLPKIIFYSISEIIIMLLKCLCYYYGGFYITILHIIGENLTYHINIAPDHDTYETNVENHYDGNNWLQLQIRNSGNFVTDNKVWTHLFGGINYQIEHHLFPNVCHVHYPLISKIVKKYCKENNIPYVDHPTVWSAYKSFLKMVWSHRIK